MNLLEEHWQKIGCDIMRYIGKDAAEKVRLLRAFDSLATSYRRDTSWEAAVDFFIKLRGLRLEVGGVWICGQWFPATWRIGQSGQFYAPAREGEK